MRTSITLILERKRTLHALVFFRGCSVFSAFTARADRRAVKQIFQQT